MPEPPVLVEVVRSGFVESRHRGSLVALDGDGALALATGDVAAPVFPRSASKPMQAAAMLHAGLDLDGELLALAAGSHSGEDLHLDGVRRILAGAGLDEAALRTPSALPLGERELDAYLRAGRQPERIVMNCSGKHAAMLATCVVNDWPTATYLDPAHPLQVAIRRTLERSAGERAGATGVDGCGAPVLALSLLALARTFRAYVLAPRDSPERRVVDAMRAHPLFAAGARRHDARLMEGLPGVLAKDGAEGIYAIALADGRAAAVKIEDGGRRASHPLVVAVLRRFGLLAPALDELARPALLGGGRHVGEIRVVDLDPYADHGSGPGA
jgi:L-asparaginase II